MISIYRSFARNVDGLGEENDFFFKLISEYRNFPQNVDSLGDGAKNDFLGKSQFYQGVQDFLIFS